MPRIYRDGQVRDEFVEPITCERQKPLPLIFQVFLAAFSW